ncbi:M66 family metalloprotease [Yersinia enterocolitica]|uniref:M66 family metalloprotease n=1 Tax=Yersinia enterocolitica TaxID=630 RepID=UPI003AB455F4
MSSDDKATAAKIPFNKNYTTDTSGELPGMVIFAQNSTIPYGSHIDGDIQPHLIAKRKTMVLFMPENPVSQSDSVTITVQNGKDTVAHYSMRTPEQLTRPFGTEDIIYGEGFWSVILPAATIEPGISIHFVSDNKTGSITKINIGAPSELIIHTIDLGMLTPYRGQFVFQYQPEYHRQYLQQIPVKHLTVSRYEPQYFKEVMLPDGVLLTDYDPSQGGVYDGTMRQRIGKELISLGIDNANYGINSTSGVGESSHPYSAAQITAHNSVGKYINGVVVHGLSGGGGIVTLEDSIGNEFSHEVGHNYGLGHYPGGFAGSIHRAASDINSCWGWDSDKDFFIPNFEAEKTNQSTCQDGVCAEPFEGHSFGRDAMASGKPLYKNDNHFTLYTPYALQKIQTLLENKVVFNAESPTGFTLWDPQTKVMEPWVNNVTQEPGAGTVVRKPYKQAVAVATLVGYYDPQGTLSSYIYPALHGSFGAVYDGDGAESDHCYLQVETLTQQILRFKLASSRIDARNMNKFHINIEARLDPVKAALFVNGKEVTTMTISKPAGWSFYTINGHEYNHGHPASLLNPSAEAGDLSGWTLDKGEFRVIREQDDIRPAEGEYYFTARAGGSFQDNIDQISQEIALNTDIVSLGKAVAGLTFKSNGWGDGDYGEVSLIARDILGKELARSKVRSVHQRRKWVDNSVSLDLPVNACTLVIEARAFRQSGTTSDVHFDGFVLNIVRALPATLQNPSAETGDLSGWTLDKGEFRVIREQDDIRPAEGEYYFTARAGGSFQDNIDQISQEIALNTDIVSLGKAVAGLTFKSNGWGDGDYGEVSLIARDILGKELARSKVRSVHQRRKWVDNSVSLDLPVNACTLVIEARAFRQSGTTQRDIPHLPFWQVGDYRWSFRQY